MLLESHFCVTGTAKQKGKSPSHDKTMSYTTASALVLLHTTHHPCQPKAAKPRSFAVVSPARTYTVTLKMFLGSALAIKLLQVAAAWPPQRGTRQEVTQKSSFTPGPAPLTYLLPVRGW